MVAVSGSNQHPKLVRLSVLLCQLQILETTMTAFEVHTVINQPVNIVVEALMNPENHPYWTTDLDRFEVIKGKGGEVGSIAHLHYVQKGRSYVMEDKLVYCEPGKKYVSQVTGDFLSAEVETLLTARGNETEMRIKWSGEGKKPVLKLLLPLLRTKLIKLAKSDMETFKRLVETRGADFTIMEDQRNS